MYQNAGGIDLLLGWQWRTTLTREIEFESGPGFHMNVLNLGRQAGLTNFNALQMGVGGMGILRWRPGWQPGQGRLEPRGGGLRWRSTSSTRSGATTCAWAPWSGWARVLGVDLP